MNEEVEELKTRLANLEQLLDNLFNGDIQLNNLSVNSLNVSGIALFNSLSRFDGISNFRNQVNIRNDRLTQSNNLNVFGNSNFVQNVNVGGDHVVKGTSTHLGNTHLRADTFANNLVTNTFEDLSN